MPDDIFNATNENIVLAAAWMDAQTRLILPNADPALVSEVGWC
jgi:hypothetical protein